MTDPAMDIAKYINANSDPDFSWVKMYSTDPTNPTFFVNEFPDDPDEAGAINRYEGQPPTETFGNPFYVRNPRVQIMIRHGWSEVALNRATDIMKLLARVKDQELNGTKYARIKPVGEPFEVGPDTKNRQRASVNMEVSFYDN